MTLDQYQTPLIYAAALFMTLVLASFLTPRSWWRRPTVRGAAIVGGGTWAIAALLLHFVAAAPLPFSSALANASMASLPDEQPLPAAPFAGKPYRVHRDLNLRSEASVSSPRLAIVPAGASVTPTGEQRGDWWQIHATADGKVQTGWASSLWLRRRGE